MDNFELKPERKPVNKRSLFWNILTILVLLLTCCLALYFWIIFSHPDSPFNIFPPTAPLPTLFQTDTPTNTTIPQPNTWTPTVTIQPSPTRTKAPTWTLLPQMVTPTDTMIPVQGTLTATTTSTPVEVEITYHASTEFYPDKNCNWMGIAGEVFGPDGEPLTFQEIQIGGTLGGANKNLLALSGDTTIYGQSGFELVLGDRPIASTQTLWIQLLDNTAQPLTDKIFLDTYDDCARNLLMIDFSKTH